MPEPRPSNSNVTAPARTVLLTAEDLLLPTAELDALNAALTNSAATDPIEWAVSEAQQTVKDFTAHYLIPETRQKRLVRALAIHELYRLAGPIPENHAKAYDAAMAELRDIRDGKFTDLAASITTPSPRSPGNWGSQTRLAMRGDPTD
jgi:hypothetical protein